MRLHNRWFQLFASLIAMIMIANLQYSWTLFVEPIRAENGWALKAVQDVDGKTLLDNTLVYWCSDVAWAYTHSFDGLRAFFLGSCGGALKTGQHVAMGGQTHQKLLVTLMNAMGVMENQFGDPAYGTGPLTGMLS